MFRQTEQFFGLRAGQPVPCPGSQHLGPFDRADLTDLGFRQPFLRRGFFGQLADRRQAQIDRARRQGARFEGNPVPLH
jgi:hypothetical protein